MDQEHRKHLRSKLQYMKEHIRHVDAIVDHLVKLKVLTESHRSDIIKLGATDQGNVQRLIECLWKLPDPHVYDNFLVALRNADNASVVDVVGKRNLPVPKVEEKDTLSLPNSKTRTRSPDRPGSVPQKRNATKFDLSPSQKLTSIKEAAEEESAANREDVVVKAAKKLEEVFELLKDLADKKLENGISLLQQLARKQVERDKKLNTFCDTMQSEMKMYRDKAEQHDKHLSDVCSQLQEEVLLYRIKTDDCKELKRQLSEKEAQYETLRVKQEKLRVTMDEDRTKLESRHRQNLHQANLIERQLIQIRELEAKLKQYEAKEITITTENHTVKENNRIKDMQILNLQGEADRNMSEKHKIYLHSQMETCDLKSQMETMKEALEKERDINNVLRRKINDLILQNCLVPSFSAAPPIRQSKSLIQREAVLLKKSAVSKYSLP